MPDYRLYLSGGAGHIEGVREINAADDAYAISAALRGQRADRMELWCGSRLVEDCALIIANQASSRIEAKPSPDEDTSSPPS